VPCDHDFAVQLADIILCEIDYENIAVRDRGGDNLHTCQPIGHFAIVNHSMFRTADRRYGEIGSEVNPA